MLQACLEYRTDFNNAVSKMGESPFDALLIAGTDSVDQIMKECAGNARLKILIIDESDRRYLDEACNYNLPVILIDSSD